MREPNQQKDYGFTKSSLKNVEAIEDERIYFSYLQFDLREEELKTHSGYFLSTYYENEDDSFNYSAQKRKSQRTQKIGNVCLQNQINVQKLFIIKLHDTNNDGAKSERWRIVLVYKRMCQMAINNEKSKNNKIWRYFSKNVYKKIKNEAEKYLCSSSKAGKNEEGQKKMLKLNQDQKKSIQCNLIYNVLQYLGWVSITCFLKKNRQKIKTLKARTFYDQIFLGMLFRNEQNRQTYRITQQMMKQSYQRLTKDRDQLFKMLFQKSSYIKIFQKSIQQYKQRVLVAIFKLIQFIQMLVLQLGEQLRMMRKENYDITNDDQANIQQSIEPQISKIFGGELYESVSFNNQQIQHVLQIQNQISSNSHELENIEQWNYKLSLSKDY